MRLYFLYISYFLFFFFSACQPPIDEQLMEAEQLMMAMPDSSLHILQNMHDSYDDMNNQDKALFGLLYFEANDKSIDESLFSEEMIDFSIDHYKQENNKIYLAYSYLYKGSLFKKKRKYAISTECLLKSLELSSQEKDSQLLGEIYHNLARIAGYQGEFDKAMDYCEIAATQYDKAGNKKSYSKIILLISWLYMAKEDFSNAIQTSKKVLQLTSDSIMMGDVLNSIGSSYYFIEQTDSSLFYLHKSLHYPYSSTGMSSRYYNISNTLTYLKQYDSALVYVNKALEYPIDVYFEEECYRVLTDIAAATNDKENLQLYLDKRQICLDSIESLKTQTNINVIEQIHQSEKATMAIKEQRFILIIAIVALILLSIYAILRSHRIHKRKSIETNTIKTELEKKHELLEEKHESLLLDLTKKIERTRAKYADMRKSANFEQREQIERTIYNEVLYVDDEKAFIDKMNAVLNHLPEKLKNDYPEITFKEILWCCLFMLQFPTSDIALLMNYKQSSQYKFKQRLCKKLNFSNSKELEQMLYDKVNI